MLCSAADQARIMFWSQSWTANTERAPRGGWPCHSRAVILITLICKLYTSTPPTSPSPLTNFIRKVTMGNISSEVSYLERGVVGLRYRCAGPLVVSGADKVIIIHIALDQGVQVKVWANIVDVSLKYARVRTRFHNGLWRVSLLINNGEKNLCEVVTSDTKTWLKPRTDEAESRRKKPGEFLVPCFHVSETSPDLARTQSQCQVYKCEPGGEYNSSRDMDLKPSAIILTLRLSVQWQYFIIRYQDTLSWDGTHHVLLLVPHIDHILAA